MKEVVLITGASGGLGSALAKKLAEVHGDKEFWLFGRDGDALRKASRFPGKKRLFLLDFSEPSWEEKMEALLEKEKPVISRLINNAGFGFRGDFAGETEKEIRDLAETDFLTPILLTSLCLPYMKKGCAVLNVSSAAGFLPMPEMALYGAAKAGLTSFSRALREELRSRGISVSVLCPYWIGDTKFISRMGAAGKIRLFLALTAEKTAGEAVRGLERGEAVIIPGPAGKITAWGARLLPLSIPLFFRRLLRI